MRTQDYITRIVREDAELTTSEVTHSILTPGALQENLYNRNQMLLYVDFTKGSISSVDLRVEVSHDGVKWYDPQVETSSGGVTTSDDHKWTMTTTGKRRYPFPIKDRYIRLVAQGFGTVTGSSLEVIVVIGTTN